MIRLTCPGCQKILAIADTLAGRVVICPGCKGKVRVPKPGPPAPAVEALEEVEELEEVEDVPPARPQKTGIKPAADRGGTRRPAEEDEDRPRRRRPPEEDEDGRPRRRRRPPKARRRKLKYESGEGIFGMEPFTVVLIGLAILSLPLLALTFLVPKFGLITSIIGFLIAFPSGLWFLWVVFTESPVAGLLCLFVPFFSIYWLITHFDECKRPFFLNTIGAVLWVASSCAGGWGAWRFG
jgi:hypothetical protein